MSSSRLSTAISAVPAGAWAVGVSGGADSVALLALLRDRSDLSLTVVHLDHQLRGDASTADAAFVVDLARKWSVPIISARRDEIETTIEDLPANPSAKYRAMRIKIFRDVVAAQNLSGVIVAHHADDQAETILHRLLRGSSSRGLAGMSPDKTIAGLRVLRPLLAVRHAPLVAHLKSIGQDWREDASNQSDAYARNRLRRFLSRHDITDALIDLGKNFAELRDWTNESAPNLSAVFAVGELADLPDILARESARRWLISKGVSPGAIDSNCTERLIDMSRDAASSSRQTFPGKIVIARRRGVISDLQS